MTPRDLQAQFCDLLLTLGLSVRQRLVQARDSGAEMAAAVAHEGGDTIFAIDRHIEPVLEEHLSAWPTWSKPLLLIAEGMGEDGRALFPAESSAEQELRYRLIVDPIDGTRNIMYDKRSAWFIAAVAPERGEATTLGDAIASVIVELPTSKQGYADEFVTGRDLPLTARRRRLGEEPGLVNPLLVRPSQAPTLHNGFAQVANFFPGTKVLASQLMEEIVLATLGQVEVGSAAVFDDQYITTAGQMVELMLGHDRFCCDLRPLFYQVLSKERGQDIRGLECHPYDVAGLLCTEHAGVEITDGLGAPLAPPLSVHHGVHWCGYANRELRRQIEPVIRRFFAQRGVTA